MWDISKRFEMGSAPSQSVLSRKILKSLQNHIKDLCMRSNLLNDKIYLWTLPFKSLRRLFLRFWASYRRLEIFFLCSPFITFAWEENFSVFEKVFLEVQRAKTIFLAQNQHTFFSPFKQSSQDEEINSQEQTQEKNYFSSFHILESRNFFWNFN